MPSHLSGSSRELAVEIMRCPILAECLGEGGYRLACYDVAVGPGGPHQGHWVPDPWVGYLTEAPLLFVSSSTAGGWDAYGDSSGLSVDSPDEALLDWEDGGFDEGQLPGIVQGVYPVDSQGNPGKAVRYWEWALARAEQALPQPVRPGAGLCPHRCGPLLQHRRTAGLVGAAHLRHRVPGEGAGGLPGPGGGPCRTVGQACLQRAAQPGRRRPPAGAHPGGGEGAASGIGPPPQQPGRSEVLPGPAHRCPAGAGQRGAGRDPLTAPVPVPNPARRSGSVAAGV